MFELCALRPDWNYFWNEYCNLRFLAICIFQFPLLIILAPSWYQKANLALRTSLRNKLNQVNKKTYWRKMIKHYFKGLYKITCYKTKSNFFQFFYHSKCFFFLLIKAFDHFEKLARFHRQVFIVNKNGEN